MNELAPDVRHRPPTASADWIRDLALRLTAADVTTAVARTSAGLDLTVTLSPPGGMATEIIVDEARYAELRWWVDPRQSPGDVAAVFLAALAAVTGRGQPPGTGRPAPPDGPDD